MFIVSSRGGVENTRLEAKDTKKIRGQGRPFRRQTLSRPRTGMLETKTKDQGYSRKCSSKKKKGLQKFFSGNLQFIGVPTIYHRQGVWEWGPQPSKSLGSGDKAPSCWAIFCNFLEKEAILMPFNHILHMFRAI